MSSFDDFQQIVQKRKLKYSKKKVNLVARQAEQASIDLFQVEPIKSKKNRKICIICGGSMGNSHYENVCSRKCSESKLMYNSISIPAIFANKLIQHSKTDIELYGEIAKFADRHQYPITLTMQKFRKLFLPQRAKNE